MCVCWKFLSSGFPDDDRGEGLFIIKHIIIQGYNLIYQKAQERDGVLLLIQYSILF